MCLEFRPGEPWKGYPNIDPETDPFVTPGSVINNLSINTVRDTDHLRDRNNGNPTALENSSFFSTRLAHLLNKKDSSRAILITEHHDAFKQCLVIHSCLQPQRFPHQYSTKHFRYFCSSTKQLSFFVNLCFCDHSSAQP